MTEEEERLAARAERDRILLEEAQRRLDRAWRFERVDRRLLPNGGEGFVEVEDDKQE
jgi:hypothetical protein